MRLSEILRVIPETLIRSVKMNQYYPDQVARLELAPDPDAQMAGGLGTTGHASIRMVGWPEPLPTEPEPQRSEVGTLINEFVNRWFPLGSNNATLVRSELFEIFNLAVDDSRARVRCDAVLVDRDPITRRATVVGYELAGRNFGLDGQPSTIFPGALFQRIPVANSEEHSP